VNGSRKGPLHWHLDVAGRRTGPHDWAVILELARSGMLGPDNLLWCPEFTAWKSVPEFPELMTALAHAQSRKPDFGQKTNGPGTRARRAIAIGLMWAVLALGATALIIVHLPNIQDGLLAARLHIFVPLFLLALGVWAIRDVWRATRPGGSVRGGLLRGAVRVPVAVATFCLLIITLSAVINSRDVFLIALGRDPLGKADLQLLGGGTELEVRGVLGAGTASRLAKMLSNNPQVRFIQLNSPGGWSAEGVQLAKLIHAHELGTYSATGCYSACVLAFIAGSPRVLNPEARLGLHSTSGEGTDPLFIAMNNEDYQGYLRRAGASEEFARRATSAAPTSLWMPELEELARNHLLDRVSSEGFAPPGEDKQ
jgi:uncharacterized protein DUF4339